MELTMQTAQNAITWFDNDEAWQVYQICYVAATILQISCNDDSTSELIDALCYMDSVNPEEFRDEIRTVARNSSIKCILEIIYGEFLVSNFLYTKIAHDETDDISVAYIGLRETGTKEIVQKLESIDVNIRFNILFSAVIILAESLKKKCDWNLSFNVGEHRFYLDIESSCQFRDSNECFRKLDKKLEKNRARLRRIENACAPFDAKIGEIETDAENRITGIHKEIFESAFEPKAPNAVYTYTFAGTIKSLDSDNDTVTIAITGTKTNEIFVVNRIHITSYKLNGRNYLKNYLVVNPEEEPVEFCVNQCVIVCVKKTTEDIELRDAVLSQSSYILQLGTFPGVCCVCETEESCRERIDEAIKLYEAHFPCYAVEMKAREDEMISVYVERAQLRADQEKVIAEKEKNKDGLLIRRDSLLAKMEDVKDFVFARYIMGQILQKLLLEFADQLANKMHELFDLDSKKLNWLIGLFKTTSDLLHEEKYSWLSSDLRDIYSKIEKLFLNVVCRSFKPEDVAITSPLAIKPEDVAVTFGETCKEIRKSIEKYISGLCETGSAMQIDANAKSRQLSSIRGKISELRQKIQAEIDEIQKLLHDNDLASISISASDCASDQHSDLEGRANRLRKRISYLNKKLTKLDGLEPQVKLFEVEKTEVDRVMELIPISIDCIGRAEEQLTIARTAVNAFKRIDKFVDSSLELISFLPTRWNFENWERERRSFQILFEVCTLEIRFNNGTTEIQTKQKELEKEETAQNKSMPPAEWQCDCIKTLTDHLHDLFLSILSQCSSRSTSFRETQNSILSRRDDSNYKMCQDYTQTLLQDLRKIRFDDIATAEFEEIHEVIAERAKCIEVLKSLLKKVEDLSTRFGDLKLMNLDLSELESNYGQIQERVFEKTSVTAITDALTMTNRLMTALHEQKGKLTQTQTKLDKFKSDFESIVEKIHDAKELNDEMAKELQRELNNLSTRLVGLEGKVHGLNNSETNCNEMMHQATSGCEKLLLAARIVEAISKLNNTVNHNQEEINSESKIESRRERITIAIIIIFCVVMCSVTATFFTIEKLLRFSMQVSMSLCAAGLIAMIIALSLLIHKNFNIESLTKRNDTDRKELIAMNQRLNLLASDQEPGVWRRILQNNSIPTS
jgi:predicted RNase H-like HicB family nuclease